MACGPFVIIAIDWDDQSSQSSLHLLSPFVVNTCLSYKGDTSTYLFCASSQIMLSKRLQISLTTEPENARNNYRTFFSLVYVN